MRRAYPPAFEALWREYPNKAKKWDAFKAWEKRVPEGDREELLQHVIERARFDVQWHRGYVPHLMSFINGARWEDDYKRIASARFHPKFSGEQEIPSWKAHGFDSPEAYQDYKERNVERISAMVRGALH